MSIATARATSDDAPDRLSDWVPLPRYLLRRRLVQSWIRQLPAADYIEIGAASGDLAAWMRDQGMRGVAVEISPAALVMLRQRLGDDDRVRIFGQDVARLDATADLLVSMEVLEHIEDDLAALGEWHDRIRPGGHMILSVPAHQSKFSAEDRMAGHYRRYEKDELQQKLAQVGFEVERIVNYGFPLGLCLKQLRNVVAAIRLKSDARDQQTRTEASGVDRKTWRRLRWVLNDWTMTPFHWMQLPFLRFDLGDGLLVLARRS